MYYCFRIHSICFIYGCGGKYDEKLAMGRCQFWKIGIGSM